jgi:hypothetical protein
MKSFHPEAVSIAFMENQIRPVLNNFSPVKDDVSKKLAIRDSGKQQVGSTEIDDTLCC